MLKLSGLFSLSVALIASWGCQQKLTKSITETTNVFNQETVLVDTRSDFDYTALELGTGSAELLNPGQPDAANPGGTPPVR